MSETKHTLNEITSLASPAMSKTIDNTLARNASLRNRKRAMSVDDLLECFVYDIEAWIKGGSFDAFHISRGEILRRLNEQVAAPDMLAALKEAREALSHPPFVSNPTLKTIDAAIAKAKGGAK
jgi:hypothetical protein